MPKLKIKCDIFWWFSNLVELWFCVPFGYFRWKFLSHPWVLSFLDERRSIGPKIAFLEKTGSNLSFKEIDFLTFPMMISIFCHQGNVAGSSWGVFWKSMGKGFRRSVIHHSFTLKQCLKITKNVAFEFFNFVIFHQSLSY